MTWVLSTSLFDFESTQVRAAAVVLDRVRPHPAGPARAAFPSSPL
jgi:hypothetical protein